MELSFEEALEEIIIGRTAYDNDRHQMALYAIQNFRILKKYLPDDKSREMSELIAEFLKNKINSFSFEQKAKELQARAAM